MMAQWHSCKEAAPDTILFFRLGDFYEAFYEDALLISKELDLTLTKRQEIPMAGVPFHMCDTYIDRLVAKGHRVAIAEQMEDPRLAKGIVKREIVRIVTPGTIINSSLLSDKEKNFLAAIITLNQTWALAFLDITTAEFSVMEFDTQEALFNELTKIRPKELVLIKKWREGQKDFIREMRQSFRPTVHFLETWHFDPQTALEFLLKHFKVHSLDGFGLKGMIASINAAGALLSYVHDELNIPIDHITTLSTRKEQETMHIDGNTQRNLELIHPLHEGHKETTLLALLDETQTPMGGRLLRDWILHPLLSVEKIGQRQDAIEALLKDFSKLLELRQDLNGVRDLERLIMRIETGFAIPRDVIALRFSLEKIPSIQNHLEKIPGFLLQENREKLGDTSSITEMIAKAMIDEPPLRLSDGGIFRQNYHDGLDELLEIKKDSNRWIVSYQERLRATLQIKTLKISYTKAFGYYIEVSKGSASKIPNHFQRRQTLINSERFITEELKEFEYKILSADEKIAALEMQLFQELRHKIAVHASLIRQIAKAIGEVDCLASLAKIALQREYTRPHIDISLIFSLSAARHPVIESIPGQNFIPNDLFLDGETKQLAVITGPNMAGKSTFIRQAALIVIMAQMGSFVPAKQAHIGIIDKVFTRIGASDDLMRGQSTFMVEMTETANILRNVSDRSLVILDEIGRGTSTYDGISIAWSVAEFLLSTKEKQAKTLFATHYFEMTELAKKFKGAFNLTVEVKETAEEIVFLRKIILGVADKSYGIHVARLAGLPQTALRKAEEKLKHLEKQPQYSASSKHSMQLDLFNAAKPHPHSQEILTQLQSIDPNQLTPLEALQLVTSWKKKITP